MSVTSLIGASMLFLSCLLWGIERGRRERERLLAIEGLMAFVSYTEEQISTFRTPLNKIYKDFSNKYLDRCGFTSLLSEKGLDVALGSLQRVLSAEVMAEAYSFAASLGGGYSEGQQSLCRYTLSRLEGEKQRLSEGLSEKIKMYRLLPILFAACIIILLI